ncbi:MAG: glycoside hydrolase family 15 protein [Chloroflexi bacterium]|nr:glycoside hydrolase family 15 protein [Chloroflexota bacterium]
MIGDAGFLSDCHTAAIVSRGGSIDWYCPGRFDAPAVFARLLDPDAGHWSIAPVGECTTAREYLGDGLVLRTTFTTSEGAATVTDALTVEPIDEGHRIGLRTRRLLVRRVEGLRGRVPLRMEFRPRTEYGLGRPLLRLDDGRAEARGGPLLLELFAPLPMAIDDDVVRAEWEARPGARVDLALRDSPAYGGGDRPPERPDAPRALDETIAAWELWAAGHGRAEWAGSSAPLVRRSAAVLQGLTYAPSGALVAAATTSLPERIGGTWNWDYRFAWLRDASFALRAQWVAACPDEATRYFRWLASASGPPGKGRTQIVFGVEGERDLTEHALSHLKGFRGSQPVRVGNDAWSQEQTDVMGEVLDSAHVVRRQLGDLDEQLRAMLVGLADEAAARWREPDSGMWEARDEARHYTSSKALCWVALDRAVKLAPLLAAQEHSGRWSAIRDEISTEILRSYWNDRVAAFTGAIDSDELDASVLILPLLGFLPGDDPRMRSTVAAIERQLGDDGLVRRWSDDPNPFLICSYWLASCLTMAGEGDRAATIRARLDGTANDLGLLAEMVDRETVEPLGNIPQALSHAALINTAWRAHRADRDRASGPSAISKEDPWETD